MLLKVLFEMAFLKETKMIYSKKKTHFSDGLKYHDTTFKVQRFICYNVHQLSNQNNGIISKFSNQLSHKKSNHLILYILNQFLILLIFMTRIHFSWRHEDTSRPFGPAWLWGKLVSDSCNLKTRDCSNNEVNTSMNQVLRTSIQKLWSFDPWCNQNLLV